MVRLIKIMAKKKEDTQKKGAKEKGHNITFPNNTDKEADKMRDHLSKAKKAYKITESKTYHCVNQKGNQRHKYSAKNIATQT